MGTSIPDRDAYRTIFPWMAQETQYWSFRYILGTLYSGKTEASEISPAFSQIDKCQLCLDFQEVTA